MEMITGKNIGVLPFKDLIKISDLISYEGPILSHFKDAFGNNLLFYWVDFDKNFNRWLALQITEKQLYYYLLKRISLKDLFDEPTNGCIYSFEIGSKLEYQNIQLVFKDSLPESYYPETESYFAFEVAKMYSEKAREYEADYATNIEIIFHDFFYYKDKANLKLDTDSITTICFKIANYICSMLCDKIEK